MRKSFFKIGIFALAMTMLGLFANATQLTTQQVAQVKSTILPEVALQTFIQPIHSASNAIVSISGHVQDQYNIPVAFADIYINNRLSDYQTDSEGNYSISSISTGSTLTFRAEGYQSTSVQVSKAGSQQDVVMESLSETSLLSPNSVASSSQAIVSISGCVKDQYNIPVAFADIYINNRLSDYQTDSEGNYSISSISTGSTLTFRAEGYQSTSVQVSKAGSQQDVVMESLSETSLLSPNSVASSSQAIVSISGCVKDQYNIPVAFADIYINNRLSDYQTDSEGNYSISSISTGSTLTFRAEGYQSTSVQVSKAGSQQDVVMESLSETSLLSPNSVASSSQAIVSISGCVKDQYNIPVAFADIYINNRLSDYQTDSEGNYSISSISTGSTLTFRAEGYQSTSVQVTKAGSQQDVIMEVLSSN